MVGAPQELAANMLLTLVAGLVAKNFRVAYHDDFTVPLNLWTVTLLDAGTGKSPVLKKIMEPFNGTDIQDMICDDVSLNRLPLFLKSSKENGIIMSAEMTFFHNIFNSNADVSLLLNSFDGEYKRVERKDCCAILREPKISLGLAFQPKVLNRVKHYKRFMLMKDNGFFDRCLFSMPDSKEEEIGDQQPIDYNIKQLYHIKMQALSAIQSRSSIFSFQLTTTQREKIAEFEKSQISMMREGGKYSVIEAFCRKAKGKILRLAGILHMLRLTECNGALLGELDVTTVSDQCIEFAIKLIFYYREEMLKVFGEIDDSHLEPARKLLRRIINNGTDRFTHRYIQQQVRGTSGLKTLDELDAALTILESYGYIRTCDNIPKKGRKSITFEVHPDIIERTILQAV